MNATTLFFALLAAILLVSAVEARHHKHHKRDYVYHDLEDYENRGIFIDSVTIKPTHPKDVKKYHKTNRLSQFGDSFESFGRFN